MNSYRFVHFTDLYGIHQDGTGIKQTDLHVTSIDARNMTLIDA